MTRYHSLTPPNYTLVGLAGLAQSGKDSAAAALMGMGWERRAFADVLREFLLAIDPIVEFSTYPQQPLFAPREVRLSSLVDEHGWDVAKVLYPEVRQLLQRVGTEAGRALLGENVWVDATLGEYDGDPGPVVVTDVRFGNEVDAIRNRGGIVVRIVRPGVEVLRNSAGQVHASESALDDTEFDHVIVNDGTLEELHAAVTDLIYGTGVQVGPTERATA